jgi:hypothetical protein
MAIYTRFGSEIELLTSRLVPIWIELAPGEIKWHYSKPVKVHKKSQVTEMPMWFVTAKYIEDGLMVCDGKLFNAAELKADEGSREIWLKMHDLNPDHAAKDALWNKAGSPDAHELFEQVELAMIA